MNQAKNDALFALAELYNYFGKRTASSKTKVVSLIVDEFNEQQVDDGCTVGTLGETTEQEVTRLLEKEVARRELAKAEAKQAKVKKVSDLPTVAGSMTGAESQRQVLTGKKFLITAAQNNTHVHSAFFENLKAYAEHIGAQLLVFPFIYNKNGFQNGEGGDSIWYAPELADYMQRDSAWLGETCKVSAMNFNILPTVKYPLSGLRECMGSAEAMLVPHATIAHECVAVLGAQYGETVPALYSTGAVTQMNYIQQQAGQKAEGRHNFGAAIVEFNDFGQYWIRQIETNESGAFYDLQNYVSGNVSTEADAVEVINYGDIHAEKIDHDQAMFLWSPNGLLDTLKPEYQMFHDLLDFSALNHHNRDNHYHIAKNQFSGATVQGDIETVADLLDWSSRDFCTSVIVRSNHDDALDRWLADIRYEPRNDPKNALFYYKLQVLAYEALEETGEQIDALPHALRLVESVENNCKFLKASQSFKIGGVELGEHGHSGTNGSRGSPKQFSDKVMTTGHTHTPSIYGGCYTAGVTGKLAMGYNESGASNWVHAHVLQYVNGMRTIIHVKDNGAGDLAAWAN